MRRWVGITLLAITGTVLAGAALAQGVPPAPPAPRAGAHGPVAPQPPEPPDLGDVGAPPAPPGLDDLDVPPPPPSDDLWGLEDGPPGLPGDPEMDDLGPLAQAGPGMGMQPGGPGAMRGPRGRMGMMGRHPGGPGMGLGAGRLARQLDLSAEQRERIAAIRDRAEKRRIQSMAEVRIAAVDMRRLLRAQRPDERAIDAQIDRIASMRAEIAKARVATMFEMRSVLTSEQQRKLRELRNGGPAAPRGPDGRNRNQGDDEDRGDVQGSD